MKRIDDPAQGLVGGSNSSDVSISLVERLERAIVRLEELMGRLDGGPGLAPHAPTAVRPIELMAQRRAAFRPAQVRLLFLVSPMPQRDPPDLTDFYLATGHLYRSVRAAFVVMDGERAVPSGEAFLSYFMARGCWLVPLPEDTQGDRGRPSNRILRAHREFVREVISSTTPESLITITARVARLAREAIRETGIQLRAFEAVTVPKDLWQKPFVPRLRGMVGQAPAWPPSLHDVGSRSRVDISTHVLTLSDVARVLVRNSNKRMRVYRIADELMADGKGHDAQQVRSGVRRLLKLNRAAFDQNGAGIRMAKSYLRSEPTEEVLE